MRSLLVRTMVLLLFLGAPTALQATNAKPVEIPPYDLTAWPWLHLYADQQTYERARSDKRFVLEKLAYISDGLEVQAYVYRPVASSKKLPVVIYNRGAQVVRDFSAVMIPMAHRMGEAGFVVVAPMYRGSGGSAGRDEMGGADLNDLFNILPVIRTLPYADEGQIFLYGESRGSMMTFQALRDGFPARAAAVYGSFSNLETFLDKDFFRDQALELWPDLKTNRDAIVHRRSAIRWVDRLDVPILIMHGTKDEFVTPDDPLRFAAELARLNKPFELILMNGQNHVLTGRAAERDKKAAYWFLNPKPLRKP